MPTLAPSIRFRFFTAGSATSPPVPLVGGKVYTFEAGTTTPKATYTDEGGLTANANPTILNSRGEADIWLGSGAYKILVTDSTDVQQGGPVDDIQSIEQWLDEVEISIAAGLANTADPALGDAGLGVKTARTGAVATTQHQVNAERTSVFQFMSPAQIAGIGAGDGLAAAVCSAALQAALDSGLARLHLPAGIYQIDAPLLIKSGTSRTGFYGEHRVRSILRPNAADIKQAPITVNALFVIQDNNAHLSIENMRMTATNGYTGVGIYCKEGGGADLTGQALFSGIFKNLWIDFASTNSGFLTGAVQNTVFDTVTAENMKGMFNFEGVGSVDNHFTGFSLYNCYDWFIKQTADANGSYLTTVRGLHAYTHNRGRLFDVQNWVGATIAGVILEPAVANLGNTGLFKFKDSAGLTVNSFYALTRAGVPACAVGIEVETTAGKFSGGAITADIGLKIAGAGAVDLEFENVDFTLCTTAALQFAAATTGTIRTRGCKFNNSTGTGILSSIANAVNWFSYDDEFLNAGLGGSVDTRNITLASSGTVVLTTPRIGRDNGAAAAAYFIAATGTGTVTLVNPIWVGTPPSGRTTGSQTIATRQVESSGVVTISTATHTVTDSDRVLISLFAGTVTYTLPSAVAWPRRRLHFLNNTANLALSATANTVAITGGAVTATILPATNGKWVELVADATIWQAIAGN